LKNQGENGNIIKFSKKAAITDRLECIIAENSATFMRFFQQQTKKIAVKK